MPTFSGKSTNGLSAGVDVKVLLGFGVLERVGVRALVIGVYEAVGGNVFVIVKEGLFISVAAGRV